MHPRDGAPKEEYSAEVLAVHKDTIVGTDALPMQKIIGGMNSTEVRWKKNTKNRNEVYKALEDALDKAYATDLPTTLFLDESGRKVEEGTAWADRASQIAIKFKRAETRMVHRIKTPAGHMVEAETDNNKEKIEWSPTDHGKEVMGVAEVEQLAWKVDSPFGLTKWTKEVVIAAAAQQLGIELWTDFHNFTKHAITDLRTSWNTKKPHKEGTISNNRMCIKVECVPTDKEQGVSHPTNLSQHFPRDP